MPLLIAACPSFTERWSRYVSDPVYEAGLTYVDLGEFAAHLVELLRGETTAEFEAVFRVVEDLHIRGSSYVREAATVGLLESIQNIAGNSGLDPERFDVFLQDETRKWWRKLDRFWDGDATALREESE